MYKYINLFSISIFLTSIYILYANLTAKRNKKNTMILMILITIVVYQLTIIIKGYDTNLLQYNSQILMMLLILKLNLYKLKKHNLKFIMNINYILALLPILISDNYKLIEYDKLVLLYMLMATVYMFSISVYNYNLDKCSKVTLILNLSYIAICLLVKKDIYIVNMGYTLELISSMAILVNIYKIYIKELELKNIKLSKKISLFSNEIINDDEKLDINKNISKTIKENLDKKNKLLNTILDQSNKCVILIDNLGNIVNEDESFYNMWREYKSSKGNISLLEFLDSSVKNKDKFLQYLNLLDKKTDKLKGEFEGKDGRYFACTYCKIIIDDNEIGFICYIDDITYKKKSEMKIKDNQMKYKKIVDNIPYSILLTDENNIIYNNKKSQNIDFRSKEINNELFNTNKNGDFKYIYEGDKEIFLNIDRASFRDSNSKKNVIAIRDITEYKKLLQKLKVSKEKYESLVNIIPEGIYIANFDDNKITYANSRFLEMTNYKTVEDIDIDNISKSMIITTAKDEENIKFQRRIVKSGQEDMHIECGGTIIEVNKKLNVVGIVRDITKQVKAELMEIEIEKQKIANKIKSEFFINMSHELKTPLNVISSSNQLMSILHKEDIKLNLDSQLSNAVKVTKKNADILMEIINNIMDLSKLELNVYENNKDYYNIVTLVEDTAVEFNDYVKLNDIEILFDTDEEEKIGFVDPKDIEKIILTLLTMILRYSDKKSLVDISLTSKCNKSIINIKNTGGYNYNKYINDKDRRILDIAVSLAKHIIVIYNGKIDIKTDSDKNIEVAIELNLDDDIKNYKSRIRDDNDEFIYQKYLNMCNF